MSQTPQLLPAEVLPEDNEVNTTLFLIKAYSHFKFILEKTKFKTNKYKENSK